jgi:hypothetical protein
VSPALSSREPSSSPASAVRPTIGSDWQSRCQPAASTYRSTSGGYQASCVRTAASVRVRSVNTGPAVTSSTLWPVTLSQSSTDNSLVGSTPRRLAAKPATVATSTL